MRRRRNVLLGALGVAASLVLIGAISAAGTVTGTNVLYTADADFDQGTLVNVNHDAPNSNQLQLNKGSGTFPFIWIALSQRCTIAKIDTRTGTILGEYRTIADGVGCNESSRTTVSLDGSVWVGHRGPGGVNHVGLVELNQCLDRNDNGTIETSSGYGDVKPWPGSDSDVANAQDECILHHVNTDAPPLGFFDSRHMSIDANNKLWVGDYIGGSRFVRIDGTTGTVETAVRDLPCGGYGGLIDSSGAIWSATGGNPDVLRWDPGAPDSATNPRCITPPNGVYGVAIDGDGFVWVNAFGSQVSKVSPDGNSFAGPFNNGSVFGSQGLAVDRNGDVWISSSLSCSSNCTIGHLKNDGTFVGNVPTPTGSGSTGIAVDADGKIWAANRNTNTATRIDPTLGPLGCSGTGCGDGTHVGAVDLTVDFPAGPSGRPSPFPYNYSDMTGAQLLTSTAPQGTWTVVQDGGNAGTEWGKVTWNTEAQGSVPAGTSLTVEARAADTEAALGSETYVAVTNGAAFDLTGRFIQVRVTLKPDEDGNSPVLSDIRIQTRGPSAPTSLALSPKTATNPTGDQHCVTATAKDANDTAVADVTVRFSASGANAAGGSSATNADGQARFCYTGTSGGTDNISAYADSNDNSTRDPDEPGDTATKVWFTKLAKGSFVIGDRNAAIGQNVTFWGAQWSGLNSLSGGPAPASFKGFADNTAKNPPACGDRWSTAPGNSSRPPGSVPKFIAVIVTSSTGKSGSTISGNTPRVVVVATKPGYSSNPGHAGTGTVVAEVCHL
jgi:streptogramin lyase